MKNWMLLFFIGLISILSGIVAILNPFAASTAAEHISAWAFLLIGILQFFAAYRARSSKSRISATVLAALSVLVGISLLNNPLEGMISLTVLLVLIFLLSGIAKIVLSLKCRPHSYWSTVMLSGFVSIILAFIIYTNLPFSAVGILGIMLGIELLSSGLNLFALAMMRKRRFK